MVVKSPGISEACTTAPCCSLKRVSSSPVKIPQPTLSEACMRKELTPPDSTDDRYDLSYLCSIKQYCAPTGFLYRLALLGVPHMEKTFCSSSSTCSRHFIFLFIEKTYKSDFAKCLSPW